MQAYIESRIVEEAHYILENEATVRTAAKQFGISRSTVHVDMTQKLPYINLSLASQVAVVLKKNKDERAHRGGLATKQTWLRRKGR